MQRVTIAGLSVELHGCEDLHHADKLALFPYDGGPIGQRITVEWADRLPCPRGTVLGTAAQARWWRLDEDRFVMFHRQRQVQLFYNRDFSEVCLRLQHDHKDRVTHQYFYVLQAVAYRLLSRECAVLHSVGMSVFGNGVALAGKSGVGKSTMAAHCLALEPTIEIVCEDAPVITHRGEGVYLCGSPFCGDDEACSAAEVPLRALVFLKQATENRLTIAEPKEALYQLLHTIVKPYYHEELGEIALQTALRWIETIPLYIFENDGTQEAARMLLHTLTEDGVIKERTIDE